LLVNRCILIAAGGTGGHLLPASQLARLLQEKRHEILFMGGVLPNQLISAKGISFLRHCHFFPPQKKSLSTAIFFGQTYARHLAKLPDYTPGKP